MKFYYIKYLQTLIWIVSKDKTTWTAHVDSRSSWIIHLPMLSELSTPHTSASSKVMPGSRPGPRSSLPRWEPSWPTAPWRTVMHRARPRPASRARRSTASRRRQQRQERTATAPGFELRRSPTRRARRPLLEWPLRRTTKATKLPLPKKFQQKKVLTYKKLKQLINLIFCVRYLRKNWQTSHSQTT